jgi:hypothetical protein
LGLGLATGAPAHAVLQARAGTYLSWVQTFGQIPGRCRVQNRILDTLDWASILWALDRIVLVRIDWGRTGLWPMVAVPFEVHLAWNCPGLGPNPLALCCPVVPTPSAEAGHRRSDDRAGNLAPEDLCLVRPWQDPAGPADPAAPWGQVPQDLEPAEPRPEVLPPASCTLKGLTVNLWWR